MPTIVNWIRDALRDHPELTLFLTLAAGHWVGRLKIKSFKLGAVVGCLLMGVLIAQLGGITVPSTVGRVFFLLFLFAVGYKTGPQFFRSLGRNAIVPIILTLQFCAVGLFTTYGLARALGFDAGTAAGLMSGGLLSSEAMGTATDAIGRLAVSDDLQRTMTSNVTVGYAVCYIVSITIGIFILTQVGPWVMRINLREQCQKLEAELGMKRDEPGVISAYKQFVMRAYRVPQSMDNKPAGELENLFSPERVFVERVGREKNIFEGDPDLRLHTGDRVVLSGRPGVLGGTSNPLRIDEVEELELLDVPAIQIEHILERKDLLYKTFSEIVHTLGGEEATRGVYVRKLARAGEELPMGPKVVLEPGDVLTLVGAKRHLDRIAAQLGSVERMSNKTDVVALCLAVAVGGLIGLPALHIGRFHVGLGLPVGVLLMSLVLGWVRSVRPGFGTIPEPVISLLDTLGLSAFVAIIGINAGPSFIQGIRTTGVVLFVCGVIVCVAPYLTTMLLGRYIFKLHPGILLGICAGSCTFSPGLAALQEKADSRVPVLGYGLSYALGAILYAFMGEVIVAMVHSG